MRPRAILSLVLFTAVAADGASAQDWPGWRGAGRDGKLTRFKSPASWSQEHNKGWEVEVGEGRKQRPEPFIPHCTALHRRVLQYSTPQHSAKRRLRNFHTVFYVPGYGWGDPRI